MTKAIFDLLPEYSGKAPGIDGWALRFQKFDWVIPFHEGAVRYYKEAGVWTKEAQTHNQMLISRQNALAEAWQKLKSEKPDNWSEAWTVRRREALKAGGFEVAF